MTQYSDPKCPRCHASVARFDPERVQIDIDVYHGPCLRAMRRELETEMTRNSIRINSRLGCAYRQ